MKKNPTDQQVQSEDSTIDTAVSQLVELAKQEADEWKSKYLRALADYQNLERRNRQDKEDVRMFASELMLGRLLPAIDTLQKAKNHLNDRGLDLAYKEFIAILDEKGVERIHTVGEEFNPHLMECIEVVDGEENIVAEELLPGYMLNGRVLRVAQVKVGKKQTDSADSQAAK